MDSKRFLPYVMIAVLAAAIVGGRAISPAPDKFLLLTGVTWDVYGGHANLTFSFDQLVDSVSLNPTNLTLDGVPFGVQSSPGSSFSQFTITQWAPSVSAGSAFVWIGTVASGETITFYFSSLKAGTHYVFGIDNTSQGMFSGPALTVSTAIPGHHYFELTISNPPTLDANAMLFIAFLVLFLALSISGLALGEEALILTIFGGIVGLLFGLWFITLASGAVVIGLIISLFGVFFIVLGTFLALPGGGGD